MKINFFGTMFVVILILWFAVTPEKERTEKGIKSFVMRIWCGQCMEPNLKESK